MRWIVTLLYVVLVAAILSPDDDVQSVADTLASGSSVDTTVTDSAVVR